MIDFREQIKRKFDSYTSVDMHGIKLDFNYDKSSFIVKGYIGTTSEDGCRDASWEYHYSTEVSYNGSVAIMDFDYDDNFLYLTLSNFTRVVMSSSGIIGREYPDKSEFESYFTEVLDKLGTQLTERLDELSRSILELRVKIGAIYNITSKLKSTTDTKNTYWVTKGNSRIRVPKEDLDKFIESGFVLSPKKETKKVTTKKKK